MCLFRNWTWPDMSDNVRTWPDMSLTICHIVYSCWVFELWPVLQEKELQTIPLDKSDKQAAPLPSLDIPKELWKLIDYLFSYGLSKVVLSETLLKAFIIAVGLVNINKIWDLISRSQTAYLYALMGKRVWWTAHTFLFSNPQNLGMLLIGANLNNKGLLIGENDDAHYLRPVTCIRVMSSSKIFMLFSPFSVAKINARTLQEMTSLRNKLEQLATCSHWCTQPSLTNVRHSLTSQQTFVV